MDAESHRERATWFGPCGAEAFGVLHQPLDPPIGCAVVLVPPFGWEEMASYASRRRWATQLAARGYAVVRFDFPGSGDSTQRPGDSGRLDAHTASTMAAVDLARSMADCRRLTALALGFGGLIALAAIDRGAQIDDLVLWAPPADGRSFVRTQRAFGRLQSSAQGRADNGLPDGWVESGGYVLAGEFVRDLTALVPADLATGTLRRALVLGQDGIEPAQDLIEHLRGHHVGVQQAPGRGYGTLTSAPSQSMLHPETSTVIDEWLVTDPGIEVASSRVPTSSHLVIDGTIAERVTRVEVSRGSAFCLVTEPQGQDREPMTVVLLPAWAERRSGPSRLWTEAARRCASRGVATVRLDLPGIGDADGSDAWTRDGRAVYDRRHPRDIALVLDALEREGLGPGFVLAGLSSGGYWALRTGARDHRVRGVLGVNVNRDATAAAVSAAGKLRQPARAVLGADQQVPMGFAMRLTRLVRAGYRLGRTWLSLAPPGRDGSILTAELETALTRLGDNGAAITLAFSGAEPLHDDLRTGGGLERMTAVDSLRIAALPGTDHNVRPVAAQAAVHDELDRVVRSALDPSRLTPRAVRPRRRRRTSPQAA